MLSVGRTNRGRLLIGGSKLPGFENIETRRLAPWIEDEQDPIYGDWAKTRLVRGTNREPPI
jgi:hypothetical protein